MDHEKYMREAILEAKKAYDKDEVPVGAVVVFQEEIIARGHNQVENLSDPSAHAELLCIKEATKHFNDWRLEGATLYTTLEPCLMCAGAAILARVENIIWGAPDKRHGANGSFLNAFENKHPIHEVSIEGGVLEEECAKLLKSFFQEVRWKMSLKNSSSTKKLGCLN
ncbi:MAG: tRNA-specific adenosine deaminase [Chlamydiia bacterium]|nr:tRNA-specific adenosine deaminase [Chlamydiia bacterium]MCH9615957.1 tRNA-specific adenosine deaminase [Chlamydiia bacterium]MCH9628640.1 tRNA-specific adenosine deaminase [Chlamydiia bacterium]